MDQIDKMDSFYRDKVDDKGSDDSALEDPLSFWHEKKKDPLQKILSRSEKPLFFIGVGLVLLAVILLIFIPGGGNEDFEQKAVLLSDRMDQLEKKISDMETHLGGTTEFQSQIDRLDKSVLRMDGVDASIITRLDSIAGDLASLKKETAALKTRTSTGVSVTSQKTAGKQQKTASAVYHTVLPGETLYGISRRYSVSVDAIRSLNGLSDQSSIQPGQKLKIKAAD